MGKLGKIRKFCSILNCAFKNFVNYFFIHFIYLFYVFMRKERENRAAIAFFGGGRGGLRQDYHSLNNSKFPADVVGDCG